MSLIEPLFVLESNKFQSKNDALMVVIHWILIKQGYKCIGKGENFPNELPNGSDLLPADWNSDEEMYVLRYTKANKKVLVKAVKAGSIDALVVNVLEIDQLAAPSVIMRSNDFITDDYKDFNKAFKEHALEKIEKQMKDEIISKIEPKQEERKEGERDDPLRVGGPRIPRDPRGPMGFPDYDWDSQRGMFPPPVGGRDLDPLGRGEGGMLMDPRNFPRGFPGRDPSAGLPRPLPAGAIPPGARFDPFGPLIPGPNRNPRNPPNDPRNRMAGPDPDHLPPPGYDDMFM